MDEEIDRLVIAVRADTQGFAKDVDVMRDTLEGPLGRGAEKAGRMIEASLLRAIRTGKFGFEDLARVAVAVLAQLAQDMVRLKVPDISIGGSGGGILGGLIGVAGSILGGAPGRATGGPVSPGRAYRVGENGPELFVPTSSGRVIPNGAAGGGRDVRVTINLNAPNTSAPQALARSSRQIARNVRSALSN